MNCLYFICERKFYATLEINPYRGEPPRSPRSQEAQKKTSLNRVKLRANVKL